ncbi:hypothetical protein [Flexithrix dorotheae]|uniref:hypothetical protein n=1 Tax=Flexithrix dorotheae TaxID=70993 RepID=UPI00035CB379|nr:hypothetical protein [Flexithrix dorotheae]
MFISFIFIFLSVLGCNSEEPINEIPTNEFPEFNDVVETGNIPTPELEEISGIVASSHHEGHLWCINDSGNPANLFLIDNKGKLKGSIDFPDLKNRDWEDIAIGPGSENGKNYIYIGDIGDNEGKYEYISVYRFEEPEMNLSETPFSKTIGKIEEIKIRYPDQARDAETLLVDPFSKDLFIISKRDLNVIVFKLSYPFSFFEINTLEKIGILKFPLATGGDISNDGHEILIRNYTDVYYWSREKGTSLEEALLTPGYRIENFNSDLEPQGEAICFGSDSKGFYSCSEKLENISQKLFYYSKK